MSSPPTGAHPAAAPRVLSAATTCALAVVLAAAVLLAVVPRLLGGAALTVLTGSMVPTYDPGDVVVVRGVQDAAREVEVGDVVTFQPVSDDPALVTHRVVEKVVSTRGATFVTRGDANGADDDPLVPEQVKGVALYHVPWVGHLSLWLGRHRDAVVGGTAAVLLGYAAVMLLRPGGRSPRGSDADHRRGPVHVLGHGGAR